MKSGKKRLMQFLMLCGLLGIFMMPTQAAQRMYRAEGTAMGLRLRKPKIMKSLPKRQRRW